MTTEALLINNNQWDYYLDIYKDLTSQNPHTILEYKEQSNCKYCGDNALMNDSGIIICTQCSLENETTINNDAEWRNYGADDPRIESYRCSTTNNELLYESSFSTMIGLTPQSGHLYRTLAKLQSWQMMSPHERSLKTVFDKIQNSAMAKGIPLAIIQYAQLLFKTVSEEQLKYGKSKLCRGDNRDGLIAACLFYACSLNKVNRNRKEIADIFEIDETYVSKGCKLFFSLMNQKLRLTDNIMKHGDFIDRYCSRLGLNEEVRLLVLKVADKATEMGILNSNTPPTIAAGAIFFISTIYSLNLSKQLIARQCQISEATVTKTYNKLINYLEYLL